jgi:hypothetical protein
MLGAMVCVLLAAAGANAQNGGRRGSEREGGYRAPAGGYAPAPRFRGGGPMDRRAPGGALYGYAPPEPYATPRYAAPLPRRPFTAIPGWRETPEAIPGLRAHRMAPLGGVIQSIQRLSPGRQLDAEVGYLGGRPVYRVLWVTVRGRRMDYVVDAETGAIISGR